MSGIGIRPLGEDDPKRLGPYRLLWRLTSGGMGRIYLARARAGSPLVAVKTLLTEGVVSEPDRKRFAREVELARRVDSAYTARVLDADARAGQPWMAIEYVPAPSLGELVGAAGPLPPSALSWVAAGAIQVLLALHDKGVVHRDIKPQNILLPLAGPLVIDFGISHAIDKTTTSLTLGTIDYTSPEQAHGKSSTNASDVFSLGATLFHLAVGRSPYPLADEGPLQRLARVQAGKLDLAGLPAELASLIRPCLAFEPRKRPALDDLLVSFLQHADRTSTRQRDHHWLPVRWTALIAAYEAHGRALSTDQGAAAAMADEHTRPAPPPTPTRLDTQEQARRRERERQAREARERRHQELRDLAAATVRARAQEAEKQRKAAQKRAAKAKQQEEERRKAEEQRKLGEKAVGWLVAVALAIGLLVWHPWKGDDKPDGNRDASRGSSASPFRANRNGTSSGTSAGTSGGTSSGTSAGTRGTDTRPRDTSGDSGSRHDVPDQRTRPPAPDSTEEAFKAVSAGDCLPLYDTGRGGNTIDWSARVPPSPVSCGSDRAGLVRVTSTMSGVCPSGTGKSYWSYTAASGRTTKLCLTRIYLKYYCLLGRQSGDRISIGPMTAVDCRAQRVPATYNQVMHITGVYRAPLGAGSRNCVRGQYDRTRYWSWLVDDGDTLLCTKIHQDG